MFERYTEKARRVVFFSRYEAAQFGSPFIETEHLLLGIARESKEMLRMFTGNPVSHEEIRKEIEGTQKPRPKLGASVDLPLSNGSKRVLAYAAEEAALLRDAHIRPEHLLLGLLREENSVAANLLEKLGVTLQGAREKIANRESGAASGVSDITYLHGIAYRKHYLDAAVREYNMFAWRKQPWKRRDLLVEKHSGRVMFYGGGDFDAVKFQLTPGAWTRNTCAICKWPLYESEDAAHGVGYTNGRDWLCSECHDKLFEPPITPLDDLYT